MNLFATPRRDNGQGAACLCHYGGKVWARGGIFLWNSSKENGKYHCHLGLLGFREWKEHRRYDVVFGVYGKPLRVERGN